MKNLKNYLNKYLLISKLVYRVLFGFKYGFDHVVFGRMCHVSEHNFCYIANSSSSQLSIYRMYESDNMNRTKYVCKFYIENKYIKYLLIKRVNGTKMVHIKTKNRDNKFEKLFN